MITDAGPDDLDTIAALERAGAAHPWTPSQIAPSLLGPPDTALLLSVDGHPIGHLLARAVLDEGELLTIVVHPDRRRGGHARALLAALDTRWTALGVRRAFLEVHEDNQPARALYAALGWTQVGRRPRYYPDGGAAMLLTRDLPG